MLISPLSVTARMSASCLTRRIGLIGATTAAVAVIMGVIGASAQAAPEAPAWKLTDRTLPSNFTPLAPSSTTQYLLFATNVGSASTEGPIVFTDTLPPGITPVHANAGVFIPAGSLEYPCEISGREVTCTGSGALPPGRPISISIIVNVGALAEGSTVTNQATISGGGAETAQAETTTPISSATTPFGFLPGAAGLGASINNFDGSSATRAGSHPSQLTVDVGFPIALVGKPGDHYEGAGGGARDVQTVLPRGLVVNPGATPVRCTEVQLENEEVGCPAASAVGLAGVTTTPTGLAGLVYQSALYNMVPPPGVPAEFGFDAIGIGIFVHITAGVRAGDYALSADTHDVLARNGDPILGVQVQLWGDPSSASHDSVRGLCVFPLSPGSCPVERRNVPLLTMPSACSSSLKVDASADSWDDPGNFVSASAPVTDGNGDPTSVSGCSALEFDPRIDLQPTTHRADSASGMDVDLQIPQPDGLTTNAEANLKKAVVTLPEGMSLNPSAAEGLAGCGEAQIGLTSESPIQFDAAEPVCPEASKIGSATVTTPLLPEPLQGGLYLASQNDNPFHTLLAGYLLLEGQGVRIKLAARFDTDPVTGQIKATVDDNPQLPFSDLKLHFKSGPHGVLVTPRHCGTYAIKSELVPWSAADPNNPTPKEVVTRTSSFTIDEGPNGAPCPADPFPFGPSFAAGTVNPQAAGFSPFTTTVSRSDGEQELNGIEIATPPGLLGVLKNVPLCPEPQASQGACSAASQIGETTVSSGAGSSPIYLPVPGQPANPVYLTTGYRGAPFGLSVVVPAVAGPFNLGTVVVRARIEVDPHTAALTITSDELPRILDGIPLRIRTINVMVDRPEFTFNPTNCAPRSIGGSISGTQGTTAAVADRFQATGCASLSFRPQFSARTSGKTSKAKGASLRVKIAYPSAGQANIAKVDLEIPKILPTRLTTIQKACTESQFNANPAGCPSASLIATAVVHTPLLLSPLTGPAYFVSHGGAAFPDVEMVLQGEGVTLILDGKTQIKNGATFSHFEAVPDAPFTSFEFDAPQGPFSIFGATADLCTTEVRMPTKLTGQNGAVLSQSTLVEPEGCPRTLTVLSHKLKQRTITLTVGVPSAGRLAASGRGLSDASRSSHGRGPVTVTLKAKRRGRLKTKVKLTFTPAAGKERGKLVKTVSVKFPQ